MLALRGDPPQGETEWTATEGGLRYSRELIELIRDEYPEFAIGAACFPEVHIHAESAEADLRYLKEKVDAGARFLITQLFFDNAYFYDFVARAREIGIDVPIVPGIMPITNYGQIRRITEMCGSVIPVAPGRRARRARRRPARGDRLRRRLRDAAVRRPAGQGRARDPLLHAQPLPGDARDPQRAARDGAVARRGARLAMGKVYEGISEHQREWIARQAMFFVGSAPLDGDGHVNVSPKGPIGSLRVLDDHTVAYLDVVGSGAETIAHIRENGRVVVMLCAFEGPPRILRLHGRGEIVPARTSASRRCSSRAATSSSRCPSRTARSSSCTSPASRTPAATACR